MLVHPHHLVLQLLGRVLIRNGREGVLGQSAALVEGTSGRVILDETHEKGIIIKLINHIYTIRISDRRFSNSDLNNFPTFFTESSSTILNVITRFHKQRSRGLQQRAVPFLLSEKLANNPETQQLFFPQDLLRLLLC